MRIPSAMKSYRQWFQDKEIARLRPITLPAAQGRGDRNRVMEDRVQRCSSRNHQAARYPKARGKTSACLMYYDREAGRIFPGSPCLPAYLAISCPNRNRNRAPNPNRDYDYDQDYE